MNKILIVDDDTTIQSLLTELLTNEGYVAASTLTRNNGFVFVPTRGVKTHGASSEGPLDVARL